jgi:hypothetical protein
LAILLPLFFSGLREANPPAQYALAYSPIYRIILSIIIPNLLIFAGEKPIKKGNPTIFCR